MAHEIPDVDLDVKERDKVVTLFPNAIVASQVAKDNLVAHKTGMYFQRVPRDPVTLLAAFPYEMAEEIGYYKVDFLSNHVYGQIRDMAHLDELLAIPVNWEMFQCVEFVRTLFHFGGEVDHTLSVAEVVALYKPQSVLDLAHLVAMKLPAKKHLISESWEKVRAEMWIKDPEKRPQFKKSHSVAYALCILIDAQLKALNFFK